MIQINVNMAAGHAVVRLRQMALRMEEIDCRRSARTPEPVRQFWPNRRLAAMGGGTSSTIQATIKLRR